MTFDLVLQTPGGADDTLLTRLAGLADEADGGGCLMAWTTTHGIRAFLDNPAVDALTRRAPFELVIGTDSITDPDALTELGERLRDRPLLSARVFVHGSQALFHPKLAWLSTPSGLALFVGSGNLTRGGLGANWEAFTVTLLAPSQGAEVRRQLDGWMIEHDTYLLDVDDPRVAAAVEANVGNERALKTTSPPPSDPVRAAADACLVAEIPKNRKDRDRINSLFSQATFTKAIFESFFGLTEAGGPLLLYPVAPDGSVGALESREGRYKPVSKNYYAELSAVGGWAYPADGPPVAVFRRLETGEFLYLVRIPGDNGYAELSALLDARWMGTARQRRRVEVTLDDLTRFWSANPLLAPPLPGM